jgi:hypothetical protein
MGMEPGAEHEDGMEDGAMGGASGEGGATGGKDDMESGEAP